MNKVALIKMTKLADADKKVMNPVADKVLFETLLNEPVKLSNEPNEPTNAELIKRFNANLYLKDGISLMLKKEGKNAYSIIRKAKNFRIILRRNFSKRLIKYFLTEMIESLNKYPNLIKNNGEFKNG